MKLCKASRIILGITVIVSSVAAFVLPAAADSYGGGSVQGYAADTPLNIGTIVQLDSKSPDQVQIATQSNAQNMFGVVVNPNQQLVSSSNSALQNEAFVAVSGTYNVLVSSQGGSIAVGDYVTISSIDGVAMKASTAQSTVFGRATQAFDGKGVTLGTSPIKDTSGNTTQTVTLGSIPVRIDVEHNPNVKSTKVNLPQILQRLGEQIAEKQISPVRVYLSVAITAAAIITAVVMLASGIRNAVISIGRNPMSRKSIFRALLQIVLTSLLILIIGMFAVYLLLKL